MHGLIIDDHELFREGLRLLLEQAAADFSFDAVADTASAVKLLSARPFQLVLIDWNLEGLSGPDAIAHVQSAAPAVRIVVVSAETDARVVRAAIEAGASGYIPKTASPSLLTMALRLVCAGGVYLPSGPQFQSIRDAPTLSSAQSVLPALTDRQLDVFKGMMRGASNKIIARDLGISDGTVKVHLTAIFRALDVKSRTEAVYVAAKRGLKID